VSQPRIRRATLADTVAICDVHQRSVRGLCAAAYGSADIDAWVGPRVPADYEVVITGTVVLVADGDDGVAGFTILSRRGELHALYVHPAAVRRGVGSALLTAVEREARAAGLEAIALNATLNSVPFYARHGYADLGASSNVLPNGVRLPCVRMAKRLLGAHEA
jgi:putative acetyltransferase